MIDPNQIENDELREYLSGNPDAELKQIINHFKEIFIQRFRESADEQEIDLIIPDNQMLKIENAITTIYQDIIRQGKEDLKYEELRQNTRGDYKRIKEQAKNLSESDKNKFVEELIADFEEELDEIASMPPSESFEVPGVNKKASLDRDNHEEDTKKDAEYILRRAKEAKNNLRVEFENLLNKDLNTYGVEIKGGFGRGPMYREVRQSHKDEAQEASDQLMQIVSKAISILEFEENKTNDPVKYAKDAKTRLPNAIIARDEEIYSKFAELRKECMELIQEAVKGLARSEKTSESLEKPASEPQEISEEKRIMWQSLGEELKTDTDYKPKHQKKEPEKRYFDEEPVEEVAVEEPKSIEPEDAKDAKKFISPELAGLATTLENFKTLVMMEINEGLDPKAALDKVQELMLLEEQKKLEEKKSAEKVETEKQEVGKSGLEDVMEDSKVKESDVTKALQEITRDGKEDKTKEESEIQENPFL